jgi:hypothetical protein
MSGCGDCGTFQLSADPVCCGSFRSAVGGIPPSAAGTFLQSSGGVWVPSSWTLPTETTADDLGKVLTATAAGVSEWQPLYQRKMLLCFGSRQFTAAGIYLFPWAFDSASVSQIQNEMVPMAGRISKLRVRQSTPVVSTDNLEYRLFVNGGPTALTVTLNTNTASGSNLTDVVTVEANDFLTFTAINATATRAVRAVALMLFEF